MSKEIEMTNEDYMRQKANSAFRRVTEVFDAGLITEDDKRFFLSCINRACEAQIAGKTEAMNIAKKTQYAAERDIDMCNWMAYEVETETDEDARERRVSRFKTYFDTAL